MSTILIRILFGAVGILTYAFLSAKDKDDVSIDSVTDYFRTYYVKWAIVLIFICLISVLLHFAPDAGTALQAVTALELTTNVLSFFYIGYNMSSVTRKIGN